MLDAAISPDGKRLAMVSNQGSSSFRLLLSDDDTGDFLLRARKRTQVRACKVVWRGDGQELLVVQADAGCGEDVGTLSRVADRQRSRNGEDLNAAGDDPAYQPLTLGG